MAAALLPAVRVLTRAWLGPFQPVQVTELWPTPKCNLLEAVLHPGVIAVSLSEGEDFTLKWGQLG